MDYLFYSLVIGAGATAVMDVWGVLRRPLMGVPAPDYALLGRWIAGFTRGRFRHQSIAASPAVRDERTLGWTAHYLIGVAFAGLLLGVCGVTWVEEPTLVPALLFGIGTVAAPFLLMQPGMGAGVAARRTANPAAARLQSFITHAVFGLGLYGAGVLASFWYMPPP